MQWHSVAYVAQQVSDMTESTACNKANTRIATAAECCTVAMPTLNMSASIRQNKLGSCDGGRSTEA